MEEFVRWKSAECHHRCREGYLAVEGWIGPRKAVTKRGSSTRSVYRDVQKDTTMAWMGSGSNGSRVARLGTGVV